ncbi:MULTISPECIES: glycosyltransferase family protein [Tenacibaculum]|uniref:UDP-glycosyltransferase n=1 Tax=Tenacibaculum TaxID=104267 RepID=UPI001F0A9173|nr:MULTISPECIES: UDP-glycosyltransferase [Tenacibaculum]MCH3881940.1 UDP-glycosyltransferase [Tenacibaculum aquimarinum]MDO6600693.1 UDP-glycosyltransferase [Tenacibaculum sp. 1_MG-2023]
MKNNTVKSVLILSESIDVNDSSGSKVNVALINNIYKLGYKVKVLHYSRKEIRLANNIECVNIKETKFSINYLLSRTQRVISRVLKVDMSNFLENIFGHSFTFFNDTKSISKALKEHYNSEDLIITLSKGASFRPHYAMLKLPTLQNKWLAYVHDPYPFHFYPRPYNWVEKGYKFKEAFFREVSVKAKYSAFPSLLLKEWMGSYYSNFLNTGLIIPHQNIESNKLADINLPNHFNATKFSLLHAGNLMKQRSPKGLIEGYLKFLGKNKEANNTSQLLLIGPNSYHKEYLSTIKNDTIYIDGYVDFEIINELQKNVSVNIILESKSEISPFLPGKFPHCVSANKPILLLGPHYSETKRLMGNQYKFVSEADNVEVIAQHIETLYLNWLKGENQKLNRKDLEDYVDVQFLDKQLKTIIND